MERTLLENQYCASGRPPQAKKFEGPHKHHICDEWGNRKLTTKENIFDIIMPWKVEFCEEIVPEALSGNKAKGSAPNSHLKQGNLDAFIPKKA